MKTLLSLFILLILATAQAEFDGYKATISDLDGDQKKIIFTINADKKIVGEDLFLDVSVLDETSAVAVRETAQVNKTTADIIEYKITNNQTKERGLVTVKDKIKIEYTVTFVVVRT